MGWETWYTNEWARSNEYEVLETTKLGYTGFEDAMTEGQKRAEKAKIKENLNELRFRGG